MKNVLFPVRAARTSSRPVPGLYPDYMLAELLALQEEMIEQLRLERLEVVSNADFLTGLIDEHEKAAALLRTQLASHVADGAGDGVAVILREDGDDAERSLATGFAQGDRVPFAVSVGIYPA